MRRVQRRSFLGMGMAGAFGLWGREWAATGKEFSGRAKSVLVILEQGGLSHLDTWDPKPDAPADHRSIYQPISTNVPGIQFTELLRHTARVADKLTVIRSMHHTASNTNGHPLGTRYVLSGEVPGGPVEMPDIGSVAAHVVGSQCEYLPPYIMIPGNHEQAKETRLGFLPATAKVFKTGGKNLSDPNWTVPNLGLLAGIDHDRFRDRRDLLSNLNIGISPQQDSVAQTLTQLGDQAADLLTNPQTRRAFQLGEETDAIRDRYGRGHRGQCYLLGRRMIESGVRFVTVDVREPETEQTPGGSNMNWDHHDYIYSPGSCGTIRNAAGGEGRYGIGHWVMMGSTDRAFAALIQDLDERGLLDETLVCFVSEFGRTPRMNFFQGRDHWVHGYSMVMAGAGVPGGQLVGSTDREGGYVQDRPYTPDDYAATIYKKLGIDRTQPLYTPSNRPIFLAHRGAPIPEVV
jgi:hypothetical protein